MLNYKQALSRFLASLPTATAVNPELRQLAETAFSAGWTAAGGDRLLADPIIFYDEK